MTEIFYFIAFMGFCWVIGNLGVAVWQLYHMIREDRRKTRQRVEDTEAHEDLDRSLK